MNSLSNRIQQCQKCKISELCFNKKDQLKGYGKLLGWSGGDTPDIIFVGLNPSYNRFKGLEYAFGGKDFTEGTGVEFIKALEEIGILERSYVTNAVKCSSSNNQVEDENLRNCLEYLIEEIDLIKPKYLVIMGRQASNFLQNNVQFQKVLVYNTIESKEVWHPNYVFSYNRQKIQEYKDKIKEYVCG